MKNARVPPGLPAWAGIVGVPSPGVPGLDTIAAAHVGIAHVDRGAAQGQFWQQHGVECFAHLGAGQVEGTGADRQHSEVKVSAAVVVTS